MQNWDTMQTTANYEQHNTWYNSMFATHIKSEPGTDEPPPPPQPQPHQMPTTSQLEHYLKQHHQQQQQSPLVAMDTMSAMTAMTPSPSNADSMQHFFDSNMQQQLLQQQQYQQQFQHAQQAAAQNQLASAHLPLGFNPLTPPGLPSAVLPTMPHFYNPSHAANMRTAPQTPSPRPLSVPQTLLATTPMDASEKLQSALTPRNTPPMDITPPKSPKPTCSVTAASAAAGAPVNSGPSTSPAPSAATEKDHDLLSNASEEMKFQHAESEDDESIRMPIYNSHGKMKNYKCKSCGMVAITKVAFWAHARTHMKPEKILQCPKCPFVTELKHHLEYHIRKHKNLKPFQCDKCSYTCVNKSMLNSHRKSHSSVYQYRCSDCDYATKYCHSFKLHLRKYEHQPGLVLDEEGLPNPSVVIDVYGTRRGPKTKSAPNANKRNHSANGQPAERRSVSNHNKPKSRERKVSTSQLSAALQSFAQHQLPSSPAKSTSSTASEFASNMTMQHQQQLKQEQQQQQKQKQQQQQNYQPNAQPGSAAVANPSSMSNLLPPLASILQQNPNMAFFPYWNLNLQMLAAQQQAVLAQLSPRMRETAMQQLQLQHQHADRDSADSLHEDDDEDDDDCERRSIDSAMDLSQGTPSKEEQPPQHHTPPAVAMNLKLQDESNETPLNGKNGASRRKGRVLKLDALLQVKSASQSPEQIKELSALIAAATSGEAQLLNAPSPAAATVDTPLVKMEERSDETEADGDGSMEASDNATNAIVAINNASPGHATTSADTSASSAASSSGNSSNSSTNTNGCRPVRALYECKYCDIFFKDTVLYTIHMGYHSCDDVFKCNMCGEKCDGPVGLFVHMARNAHS